MRAILGKHAGTVSHTWIGADPPHTLYAVGLAGTDYDQVHLTFSIALGADGRPPANDTSHGAQPIVATQKATVPKGGYLAAFDGTWRSCRRRAGKATHISPTPSRAR